MSIKLRNSSENNNILRGKISYHISKGCEINEPPNEQNQTNQLVDQQSTDDQIKKDNFVMPKEGGQLVENTYAIDQIKMNQIHENDYMNSCQARSQTEVDVRTNYQRKMTEETYIYNYQRDDQVVDELHTNYQRKKEEAHEQVIQQHNYANNQLEQHNNIKDNSIYSNNLAN